MNKTERTGLANEIQDRSDQIEKLADELAAKMNECDDLSYTAEVVQKNIYKMLGVNGYYNGTEDVSGAIDYLNSEINQ